MLYILIENMESSPFGAMGSAASWESWDMGLIPSLAQWIKDHTLLQLQLRLQLRLGSDSWPGTSICCRAAKNEEGKKNGKHKGKKTSNSFCSFFIQSFLYRQIFVVGIFFFNFQIHLLGGCTCNFIFYFFHLHSISSFTSFHLILANINLNSYIYTLKFLPLFFLMRNVHKIDICRANEHIRETSLCPQPLRQSESDYVRSWC